MPGGRALCQPGQSSSSAEPREERNRTASPSRGDPVCRTRIVAGFLLRLIRGSLALVRTG